MVHVEMKWQCDLQLEWHYSVPPLRKTFGHDFPITDNVIILTKKLFTFYDSCIMRKVV